MQVKHFLLDFLVKLKSIGHETWGLNKRFAFTQFKGYLKGYQGGCMALKGWKIHLRAEGQIHCLYLVN